MINATEFKISPAPGSKDVVQDLFKLPSLNSSRLFYILLVGLIGYVVEWLILPYLLNNLALIALPVIIFGSVVAYLLHLPTLLLTVTPESLSIQPLDDKSATAPLIILKQDISTVTLKTYRYGRQGLYLGLRILLHDNNVHFFALPFLKGDAFLSALAMYGYPCDMAAGKRATSTIAVRIGILIAIIVALLISFAILNYQ